MKRTKSKLIHHHRSERYTKLSLSPTEPNQQDEAQTKSRFTPITSTIPNHSFSSPSQSPFAFMSPHYPPASAASKSQSSTKSFVNSTPSSNSSVSLKRTLPKPNLAAFVEPQLEHSLSFNSTNFRKNDPFSTPRSGRSSTATPSFTRDRSRFTWVSPSSPALTESKLQFIEKSPFLARLVPNVSHLNNETASSERFASGFDELFCDEEDEHQPMSPSSASSFSSLSSLSTPRSAATAHLDHLSQHVLESKIEIEDCIEVAGTSPISSLSYRSVSQLRPIVNQSPVLQAVTSKCDSWRGAIHIDETLFYNLTPSQILLSSSQSVSSPNANVRSFSPCQISSDSSEYDIELSSQRDKRQKLI